MWQQKSGEGPPETFNVRQDEGEFPVKNKDINTE
jgi:hypothetical protein